MDTSTLIERTELHDSSLIQMVAKGHNVRLRFENVWIGDDNCYRVTIDLGGVRKVTCDNRIVTGLRMETEDGGVIAFRRSGNIADMVITWTSYAPRIDETRAYQFDFTTFTLRAEKQNQGTNDGSGADP